MKRISGITYLKAVLPIFVVSCHIRPFGVSSSMNPSFSGFPDLKDVFYSNISALAVPLFFMVSFYLYLLKRSKETYEPKRLLKDRVIYFAELFVLCRVICIPFGIGSLWVSERGLARNLYRWIFAGGDTLFYYFEISIYLFILLELFLYITEKLKLNRDFWAFVFTVLSSALLFVCGLKFVPETVRIEALRFFSPIGFLPYPFIAVLVFDFKDRFKNYIPVILAICGIGLSVAEWGYLPDKVYLENGYALTVSLYQKLSVVLISAFVFIIVLKIKKQPSKIIEYMSELSLYVYCIHQFIITLTGRIKINPLPEYLLVVVIAYALSMVIYYIKTRYINNKSKKISEEIKNENRIVEKN